MTKFNNQVNGKEKARSWFAVWNNPGDTLGVEKTEKEMVEQAVKMWVGEHEKRACAINFEIGETGTPHMHMVLEAPEPVRFSTVKNTFRKAHIEPTRGNKKEAEDYINKRGKFEEKNNTLIVAPVYYGEIQARKPGKKNEDDNEIKKNILDDIDMLIRSGCTPSQILDLGARYWKHEAIIRKMYFDKRKKETPMVREVKVYWHVGKSGTGKSYVCNMLEKTMGADHVYLLTDYSENGGFDMYCGEEVLFLDEFKGKWEFGKLLTILDCYRAQTHARYANIIGLWSMVHITSVYPPETVYGEMVQWSKREVDNIDQLKRRIDAIIYHYTSKNEDGSLNYKTYEMPMGEYQNYDDLVAKAKAFEELGTDGFYVLPDGKMAMTLED